MISFYTHFIKPLVAGPMLEKYIVISSSILLVVLIIMIVRIIKGKSNPYVIHIFNFFLFIGMLVSVFVLIFQTPSVFSPNLPLFEPVSYSEKNPLTIIFDRPVGKQIKGSITPYVSGVWRLSTSPFRMPFNQLSFYPESKLPDDTEFAIEITNIAPMTGFNIEGDGTLLFIFRTKPNKSTSSKTSNHLPEISRNATPVLEKAFAENLEPSPEPQPTTFILSVPQYKQTKTFTCFSVASKMALGFRGVNIDEVGFVDEIGKDTTERNFVTNMWGNPNKGVVGTLDGSGPGGYGVHWDPVAQAMSKYRKVEVKRNWNIPEMLNEIERGNPVMIWWINGVWPAKDVSWNTKDSGKVYTVNGMHVEVVVGWTGDKENPQYIWTNDPWRGRRSYTPEQFTTLWKWFENTGIVVY
jgi:uncharacterized protein YvpB